jgi:hypothetical protein
MKVCLGFLVVIQLMHDTVAAGHIAHCIPVTV